MTEGEQDHLFDIGWLHRTMRELVCARSVTARIFTAREGGEQHCQVGNSALARDEIVNWLSRFYPSLRGARPAEPGRSKRTGGVTPLCITQTKRAAPGRVHARWGSLTRRPSLPASGGKVSGFP